jgi:hypothetical protein
MRVGRLAGIWVGIALATAPAANAQVPIEVTAANTTITQNFNTLATSGLSNPNTTLPAGWGFVEAGSAANTTYAAGNGGSTAADTYSFGTNTERAFGEVTGPTVQSTVGVAIHNSTGATIPALQLSYSGEQWRSGSPAAPVDKLDFQYSATATALNTGSFTDVNGLDFASPNSLADAGELNGNSAGNRTVLSATFAANVPNGAFLWIRWVPSNIAGDNDGLGIDDFSITNLQDDGDHDGVPDAADNCTQAFNQDQADTDGDGQGNACDLDDDGDGAPDATDNCPAANADQSDIDGDGQGDACDVDDDADGVVDTSDQCPAQAGPVEDRGCPGIAHPPADGDGDGLVDGSDQCPTQAGPVENHGCPANPQPPDTSACDAAKAALAKAKAKLKKLRQHDASKRAIAKAKKKVKKAKAKVKAACAT